MPGIARARPHYCSLSLLVCLFATVEVAAQDCESLRTPTLGQVEITAATSVAAGGFEQPGGNRFRGPGADLYASLPAFCRIQAVSRPVEGSEIGIEVWLPTGGWNGKLQGVGNGAWAGSISYSAMAGALADGYAVASTDTGHRGGSADFLLGHPAKRIDFAYRAVHEMTIVAKQLTAGFYGRPQSRAYFTGCSTGGRQALTEVQRYPDDYDGVIAGAPAYYPSHIQGMQVWTAAVANENATGQLDAAAFRLLNGAAVAACDTLDGVQDGVIENPAVCSFDAASLACGDAPGEACLSPAQAAVANLIYRGPVGDDEQTIYPGLARGSENGWATLAGDAPLSLALETYALLVHGDPDWNWRSFDAATEIPLAVERIGPLMDSNDPDISDFVNAGGKLLLYHGWSDPGIPPAGTVDYFTEVASTLGPAQTDASVRLFMVPGMNHCAGGTGTDRFDAIAALDRWLETDAAPGRIEAERRENGEVVRTRPLCAWPDVAVYDGTGDTDLASSFSCD